MLALELAVFHCDLCIWMKASSIVVTIKITVKWINFSTFDVPMSEIVKFISHDVLSVVTLTSLLGIRPIRVLIIHCGQIICLHSDSSEVFIMRIWHTSLFIIWSTTADSSIGRSYSSISASTQVFKLSRWKKVIIIIFIFYILAYVIVSIVYELYDYHRVPRVYRVTP